MGGRRSRHGVLIHRANLDGAGVSHETLRARGLQEGVVTLYADPREDLADVIGCGREDLEASRLEALPPFPEVDAREHLPLRVRLVMMLGGVSVVGRLPVSGPNASSEREPSVPRGGGRLA